MKNILPLKEYRKNQKAPASKNYEKFKIISEIWK